MTSSVTKLVDRLAPFLILGVSIAVGVSILLFLAQAIFIGLGIGIVLFLISLVVKKFKPNYQAKHPGGRTIDHE